MKSFALFFLCLALHSPHLQADSCLEKESFKAYDNILKRIKGAKTSFYFGGWTIYVLESIDPRIESAITVFTDAFSQTDITVKLLRNLKNQCPQEDFKNGVGEIYESGRLKKCINPELDNIHELLALKKCE